MADDANKPKRGGGVFGSLVQAESMIQLALALPAGCLIGWFLGMLLDPEHAQLHDPGAALAAAC